METQEVVLCEIQSFQSSKNRLCTLLSHKTKQVIDDQPCVIRNLVHPLLHEDGDRRFHQTLTIYQTTWCHNIEDWKLFCCQLSRHTNYALKHKLQWRTTWLCETTPVCVCLYGKGQNEQSFTEIQCQKSYYLCWMEKPTNNFGLLTNSYAGDECLKCHMNNWRTKDTRWL